LHLLAVFGDGRLVLAGALARRPGDRVAGSCKCCLIRSDGAVLPVRRVMEDIDILRKPRTLAIDGYAASNSSTSDWNLLIGTAKRLDTLCQPPSIHASVRPQRGSDRQRVRRGRLLDRAHVPQRDGAKIPERLPIERLHFDETIFGHD
jgi:hypothetical protein